MASIECAQDRKGASVEHAPGSKGASMEPVPGRKGESGDQLVTQYFIIVISMQ